MNYAIIINKITELSHFDKQSQWNLWLQGISMIYSLSWNSSKQTAQPFSSESFIWSISKLIIFNDSIAFFVAGGGPYWL